MPISLINRTGNSPVDDCLRGLIDIFELVFPDRICGYYLIGSFVTGGSIAASDIDLRVVFKHTFLARERERIEELRDACRRISRIPLDIPPVCEQDLFGGVDDPVNLKVGALLLYGDDIRDRLPMPTPLEYARKVTGPPYRNIVTRLRGTATASFPLDYPDTAGEFFGYDRGANLQLFVVAMGWAATAIVFLKAGEYVPSKSRLPLLYRRYVGDEWTTFLDDVFETCRRAWQYQVPADVRGRAERRRMCQRALHFENHYLGVYRSYLLAELAAGDRNRVLFALARLRLIIFRDAEVRRAVEQHTAATDTEVRQAARETLDLLLGGFDDARRTSLRAES